METLELLMGLLTDTMTLEKYLTAPPKSTYSMTCNSTAEDICIGMNAFVLQIIYTIIVT